MAKRKVTRRKKTAAGSVGLSPQEICSGIPQNQLAAQVVADGGTVVGSYRDPLGATLVLLVALPIDRVEPTPYQRDPSDAHVKRLMTVIEKVGRFLDPIVVIRHDGNYWTPNGNHRLSAMRTLQAKSIVAIVVPQATAAYQILALNTEKAHNLREKALEVIRMYKELAQLDEASEETYALEFEEPALITLGLCYEERPRFSGGAYHPVLKRVEEFLKTPLRTALESRLERARKVLELDDAIVKQVDALKAKALAA